MCFFGSVCKNERRTVWTGAFTADSLADVDAHDIRNWGNDFFAAAMKTAMQAVTEVQA